MAHPLVGVCRPSEIVPADLLKSAGYMTGSMYIRGHSAGSYSGMVLERILAEFPDIEGKTVLAAIALPVKLCTAKLCPENQNKTYRDQSYPKAFPLLNKRESNFPCSLAQITPDNKATLQHTLCFSRSGLSQRRSLGIQFKYCSKVTKNQGGVFVQTANWIPVLTKFRKAIH